MKSDPANRRRPFARETGINDAAMTQQTALIARRTTRNLISSMTAHSTCGCDLNSSCSHMQKRHLWECDRHPELEDNFMAPVSPLPTIRPESETISTIDPGDTHHAHSRTSSVTQAAESPAAAAHSRVQRPSHSCRFAVFASSLVLVAAVAESPTGLWGCRV